MAEKGWTDFIEWARRALQKPSFDAEERAYRLAVAAAVRELIAQARQARPLSGPAREVKERVLDSRYRLAPVVPARPLEQLTSLAEQDEQALATLLCAFADAGEDPEARLERFLAEVKRGPGAERVPAGPLIGSLLNFGTSPERLPVVRAARYARLRELLGEESEPPAGEIQDYRRDLTFAYTVERALHDAGVPVRDMIDVDSLMSICAVEEEFWAGPGDAADSRRTSAPEVYLAIGMIYRNEAPYLAEWLEFHRLVGVERFYLYDNESDDDHLEVLAPYLEEGIVEVHEWPGSSVTGPELIEVQVGAYEHCISTHAAEARWIAIIDADEFLFSPNGRPVPEVLTEYERWPALVVNSRRYGPAIAGDTQGGLVVERHTSIQDPWEGQVVKTIVDPSAITGCITSHRFAPRRGATVDEHGYPVNHTRATHGPSFERLRINHYFARSSTEFREKYARRITDHPWYAQHWESGDDEKPEQDRAILGYVPALCEALRRRTSIPS